MRWVSRFTAIISPLPGRSTFYANTLRLPSGSFLSPIPRSMLPLDSPAIANPSKIRLVNNSLENSSVVVLSLGILYSHPGFDKVEVFPRTDAIVNLVHLLKKYDCTVALKTTLYALGNSLGFNEITPWRIFLAAAIAECRPLHQSCQAKGELALVSS